VDFATFEDKVRQAKNTQRFVDENTMTLCFDPGHTTGYAIFEGLKLVESGELATKPIETAVHELGDIIRKVNPKIIVMEDYRVYQWMTKQHGGSDLLTTRVIGVIETFCVINFVDHVIKQPAHIAKGFCTDKRLKEWEFYKVGERHARDAIRHGCYFLLFGAINRKENTGPKGTVG